MGGLERECSVCGYVERHDHSYCEDYSYDEFGHWREAECEHSGRVDYGPHETVLSYDVEDDAIVRVYTCPICGYQTRKSTYDPAFLDSVEFADEDDGLKVVAIGEYFWSGVINYPRSFQGKPVTAINLRNQAYIITPRADDEYKAAVFVPSTVKSIQTYLADQTEIDLFYDGTLKDWLAIDTGFNCKSRLNLHLKDGDGFYHLLKHVVLPEGTKTLRPYAFVDSTIESLRCNDELESITGICFMGCRYLKEVILNEGLLELDLRFARGSSIERLRIPSSVQKLTGQMDGKHLYEVVVEKGVTADIRKDAFYFSSRLVRLLDYREAKSVELTHWQSFVATASDPDAVVLHRDQDYVLMETADGFSLLDYRGRQTSILVPDTFLVDGRQVESYAANDHFLDGLSLAGPIDHLSVEEYNNCAHNENIFEATFTESLSSCGEKTFDMWWNFRDFRRAFFRMSREAMLQRIEKSLVAEQLAEMYYLENGEYVLFARN